MRVPYRVDFVCGTPYTVSYSIIRTAQRTRLGLHTYKGQRSAGFAAPEPKRQNECSVYAHINTCMQSHSGTTFV